MEKLNSVLAEIQDVKSTVGARQEEPFVLEMESHQDVGESPVTFLDNDVSKFVEKRHAFMNTLQVGDECDKLLEDAEKFLAGSKHRRDTSKFGKIEKPVVKSRHQTPKHTRTKSDNAAARFMQ